MQPSDVSLKDSEPGWIHMRLPSLVKVFRTRSNQVKPLSTLTLIRLPKMPPSDRMCLCGFVEIFRQHDVSDIVVANYEEGALDSVIEEQINAFNEGKNPFGGCYGYIQ